MPHPLAAIPADRRRAVVRTFVTATVVLSAVLLAVDQPLRTAAAPRGIIAFELARDVPTAAAIVDSWDARARSYAAFSLGLDFLYPAVYSTAFAFGVRWAAGVFTARGSGLAGLGPALAWAQWGAALCDYVENVALCLVLFGGARSPWPAVAWAFASAKFLALAVGLAYMLGAAVVRRAPAPARA